MMGCVAASRSTTFLATAMSAAVYTTACGASLTGPSGATRTLTVMTYNIQHGLDGNIGRYNLQGAIDVIARIRPDIVGLQEVTRNHPFYSCDDQPRVIADGLQRATGRHWTNVYVREWSTPDRTCLDRGIGTDVETEGLAFFAAESIVGQQELPLFQTRVAISVRSPSIAGMPIIVTHLASGTTGYADRVTQISQLLPWAAGQGTPRILIGDFNSRPDAPELQPVLAEYRDAWTAALAIGAARGVMTGDTRVRGGRIDYVLYAGDGLQLESAEIVDTAVLLGNRSEVSDHRPVVVRFSTR